MQELIYSLDLNVKLNPFPKNYLNRHVSIPFSSLAKLSVVIVSYYSKPVSCE